ncbi:msr8580 [Mesorhizobium japonicum MAFF 303099]|uniref:Msr8580 protein n=1 Tax=Mesorhizobium japonicum (strain LMG 29417 / CECT 9101 / MAFF 303099) TaxID=266835 RepID=Q98NF7_RHILO|nr:msr8580 [Mesorhizobium japonicum MAFF 303099]
MDLRHGDVDAGVAGGQRAIAVKYLPRILGRLLPGGGDENFVRGRDVGRWYRDRRLVEQIMRVLAGTTGNGERQRDDETVQAQAQAPAPVTGDVKGMTSPLFR